MIVKKSLRTSTAWPMTSYVVRIYFLSLVMMCSICSGCKKFFPSSKPETSVLYRELVINSERGSVTFRVEIADTESERALGLMNREKLEPNHGMLFIFDRTGRHPFWMKNTLISLDIIHFDDDFKVVGVIEQAQPMNLTSLDIGKESRFVLEVAAGSVKKYGINLHSVARLSYD